MFKGESKSSSQQETLPSVNSQDEKSLLDNILSQGDSYEVLKTASSGGAHFQFRNEKSWVVTDTPVNSRFRIKISLMSENFTAIPFSERRNTCLRFCSLQEDPVLKEQYSVSCPVSTKMTNDSPNEITLLSEKLNELDQEWIHILSVGKGELQTLPSVTVTKDGINRGHSSSESYLGNNTGNFHQQLKSKENSKHNLEDWLDSILDS